MSKIANRNRPIGVFDSGLGGLSVVKELFRQLPNEEVIYFGDTGRFPYGTRSAERVTYMALQDANYLLGFDVKVLLVACNTASSVAMDVLEKSVPVPIIGVVKPGAEAAAKATNNKKIGIIGTRATIASRSYQEALIEHNPSIETSEVACPLFVSLAEEGWTKGKIPEMVAEEYLAELREKNIDTLILGCTHYPLLRGVIGKVMGEKVTLIDSAESTVTQIKKLLKDRAILRDYLPANHRFIVSDAPERFCEIGGMFIGKKISQVEKVILEDEV